MIYRFASARAIRPVKFVKFLPEFGWSPYVVTPRGHRGRADYLDDTELKGVVILKTFDLGLEKLRHFFRQRKRLGGREGPPARRGLLGFLKNYLLFPDLHFFWFPFALISSIIAIYRYKIDVIYSTMPHTSNFVAYFLKRITQRPWVIDYRDLWTQNPYLDYKGTLRRKIDLFCEKAFLRSADCVVAVSGDIKRQISKLMDPDKACRVSVITNGYDPDDFKDCRGPVFPGAGGVFRMAYTGSLLDGKRDAAPLFKAIRRLIDRGHIKEEGLRLIIAGPEDLISQRIARGLRLDNVVEWKGMIPYSEALKCQREADALLFIENHVESAQIYTGKLFEYLAAKRPILALAHKDGVAAELIERAHSGIIADFCSIADIEKKLLGLIQNRYSFSFRDGVIAEFNRRNLTMKLAHLLGDVAKEAGDE